MAPARALLIYQNWAELILSGQKRWELRSRPTKKRGPIALAVVGTSSLWGECSICDCQKIAQRNENGILIPIFGFESWFVELPENIQKHCVDVKTIEYDVIYAWVVSQPIRYPHPRPYRHPAGAVTWVDLEAQPKAKPRPKRIKKKPGK